MAVTMTMAHDRGSGSNRSTLMLCWGEAKRIQSMHKVLLISAPWHEPSSSSLALGTLKPILERAGIFADNLYGNLLFPVTTATRMMEYCSPWLFLSCLYPQVSRQDAAQSLLRHYLDGYNLHGTRFPRDTVTCGDLDMDGAAIIEQALANMELAAQCIDRCVSKALDPVYDVIGLSATFETQVPASLAIARRLRALRPNVRIIMGGAACFEMQGEGLAASFPELDAVCHTEGEGVIVALIQAMRGERSLASVPGIVGRDPQAPGELIRTPPPELLRDLDLLPMPAYEDFLEQFAASDWSRSEGMLRGPQIYFETSRGCWWGEKHLCSFCGVIAKYRKKSAQRVYDEISTLYHRYPQVDSLQATDNILDLGFLKDPLPRLTSLAGKKERPLRMFFETKSNLRADQVRVLAASGITSVQGGIESFSDAILARMDKGSTGLGQVQFIKNAYETGIGVLYNILVRNPGDRPEDYEEMLELLPYIEHLPPPAGIVSCRLERFSPYHSAPARYGIRDVRPMPYYLELYPDPQVDLKRIAYVFEYDHDMLHDEALWQVQRRFVERAFAWSRGWSPSSAYCYDHGDCIIVEDRRPGALAAQSVLRGLAARVFRYLERVRSLAQIEGQFATVDRTLLHTLLATWQHRRWICRDRRLRALSVLPRLGAPSPALDEPAPESRPQTSGPRRLPVLV